MRTVEHAEQIQSLIAEHEMNRDFQTKGLIGLDGMFGV
jgi:hypothetical protein